MTIFVDAREKDSRVHAPVNANPVGGNVKRTFDVIVALLVLSAGAAVMATIALYLKVMNSGPILYGHERIGLGGQPFHCLKFRTMVTDADSALAAHLEQDESARQEFARDRKLTNDPRIIPGIGNFLRRTSLDELPQIFNVLKGEMSLIGPRPVTDDEVPLYGSDEVYYFMARPGITGLWQVSGRSSLSFSDRVRLDSQYVRRWSFLQDVKILMQTVVVVFTGKGAC